MTRPLSKPAAGSAVARCSALLLHLGGYRYVNVPNHYSLNKGDFNPRDFGPEDFDQIPLLFIAN